MKLINLNDKTDTIIKYIIGKQAHCKCQGKTALALKL